MQIVSTDIYVATQNCIRNRAIFQNYLLNLKQDPWEYLCSCRPLAQGHLSCTPVQWNSFFYSYTCEKICLAVYIFLAFFFFFFLVNLLTEKSWVINAMTFSAYCRYKPHFYFFSLNKIKMSKQHLFII